MVPRTNRDLCVAGAKIFKLSEFAFCASGMNFSHAENPYISYEFVPASPAVSCMSGSSNWNSFRDRRQVAVQLVSCGMLPPGLVQDCTQHSYIISV